MPEILERLQNKVGPLPAWAWAAIPAGAYVAWSYYKASQSANETPPEISPIGTGEEAALDDYGSLGGFAAAPSGTSNVGTTPNLVIDTNLIWQRQAINWLIAEGIDPSTATRAINAYLFDNPATINTQELAALNMALSKFGPPPEGGGNIPEVTSPPPATEPTSGSYYDPITDQWTTVNVDNG